MVGGTIKHHYGNNFVLRIFRRYVLPESLTKHLPDIVKMPNILILSIVDARNATHELKHIPNLFWKFPGPENKVEGPGAGKSDLGVA